MPDNQSMTDDATPHQRRVRYAGTHPKRYEEKYKELDPTRNAAAIQKVLECRSAGHRQAQAAERCVRWQCKIQQMLKFRGEHIDRL